MKKLGVFATSALASAVLCWSTANASINLVVNGSFETGNFTGWTADANSFPMYIVTNPVEDGIYAAQIAGYDFNPDTLSQTVADTAGQSYLLSFWRYQADGAPPIGLTVTWDGVTVFSEVNPGFQPYQNFNALVTGAGSDSLVFTSYNNPAYTYLDNVSLTAVPEPAAWIMMLVGFGGLGLAAFRGARKASVSIA